MHCIPADAEGRGTRQCRLSESVGKISAETVLCYPPGIPSVVPGEVIAAEISTNSAKIASSLARTLLQDLSQNTQVTLKVFPGDLEDIKESLKDLNYVILEADQAIAKGGIVILSSEGNIDGDIFTRFETLKKSILENKL